MTSEGMNFTENSVYNLLFVVRNYFFNYFLNYPEITTSLNYFRFYIYIIIFIIYI